MSSDAVFLVSPIADTRWFKTCIRQADRIWFFARADAVPSTPLLPPEEPSPARQFRLVDVILLHHGMDPKAVTTNQWRIASDAARLFHWRGLEDDDVRGWRASSRGAPSGLCSRAAARALTRTSAWCGRCAKPGCRLTSSAAPRWARLWPRASPWAGRPKISERRISKGCVETNPLGDYVLPVVGLTRGQRVDDPSQTNLALMSQNGDLQFEGFIADYNIAPVAVQSTDQRV